MTGDADFFVGINVIFFNDFDNFGVIVGFDSIVKFIFDRIGLTSCDTGDTKRDDIHRMK